MQPKEIETLFCNHYARLFGQARCLLGNDEEARDAVSDVFEKLLLRRDLSVENAEAYLLSAVRNNCINRLNRKSKQEQLARLYVATANEEPPFSAELWESVARFIDTSLPERTRQIVLLRYSKGLSYNDIQTLLGISRIAIYKHLRTALTRIRTALNHKSEP